MIDVRSQDRVVSYATLFKAVPIGIFQREASMTPAYECIKKGFVVVTYGGAIIDPVPNWLANRLSELYGSDVYAFNQTFHKSFDRVASMSASQYFMEQFIHYFSTYGAESFGKKAIPYIPVEKLEIPDVKFDIDKITVITAAENYVLEDLLVNFLMTTTHPSNKIIKNFNNIVKDVPTSVIDKIKSYELMTLVCKELGVVPEDPTTALRYLVFNIADETLLIKNKELIRNIRKYAECHSALIYDVLSAHKPEEWATIFFRYKPLFLAFKKAGKAEINSLINTIRRKADEYHITFSDVNIRNASVLISEGRKEEFSNLIKKASNRDLVKLVDFFANYYWSRPNVAPAVYNIRNGKTFVNKDRKFKEDKFDLYMEAIEEIIDKLKENLSSIKGKKFFIPNYIEYSVPYSEKQFSSNYPWGTFVRCPKEKAFTAGIQWFDQGTRTDIDLHMQSVDEVYGWNSSFRNTENSVIFSGDMTAAPLPNGAAEAFYFKPEKNTPYILTANLYNVKGPIDFKFGVSTRAINASNTGRQNFIFKDFVFAPISLQIPENESQMTLGMFIGSEFFFFNGRLSRGCVPNNHYSEYIDGIKNSLKARIRMSELIEICGGKIIDEEEFNALSPEEKENVVNLSPEALTVNTLLNIVDGVSVDSISECKKGDV